MLLSTTVSSDLCPKSNHKSFLWMEKNKPNEAATVRNLVILSIDKDDVSEVFYSRDISNDRWVDRGQLMKNLAMFLIDTLALAVSAA